MKLGYTYLMKNSIGHYKIGMTTKHPDERLRELARTGSSIKITMDAWSANLDCYVIEQTLQRKFSMRKTEAGNEWFDLNDEDVAYIHNKFLETAINGNICLTPKSDEHIANMLKALIERREAEGYIVDVQGEITLDAEGNKMRNAIGKKLDKQAEIETEIRKEARAKAEKERQRKEKIAIKKNREAKVRIKAKIEAEKEKQKKAKARDLIQIEKDPTIAEKLGYKVYSNGQVALKNGKPVKLTKKEITERKKIKLKQERYEKNCAEYEAKQVARGLR